MIYSRKNYFENVPAGLIAKENKMVEKVILSPGEKLVIIPTEEYRISSKQLPRDIFTIISEDDIFIFTWGETPSVIVINDKKIAKDYLLLFEGLWKEAKKISHKDLSSLELDRFELG